MVFAFVAVSLLVWAVSMLAGLILLFFKRIRYVGPWLIFGSTLGVTLAIAAPLVVDPFIPTQPGYNGNAAYIASFALGCAAGIYTGVKLAKKLNLQLGWTPK